MDFAVPVLLVAFDGVAAFCEAVFAAAFGAALAAPVGGAFARARGFAASPVAVGPATRLAGLTVAGRVVAIAGRAAGFLPGLAGFGVVAANWDSGGGFGPVNTTTGSPSCASCSSGAPLPLAMRRLERKTA